MDIPQQTDHPVEFCSMGMFILGMSRPVQSSLDLIAPWLMRENQMILTFKAPNPTSRTCWVELRRLPLREHVWSVESSMHEP